MPDDDDFDQVSQAPVRDNEADQFQRARMEDAEPYFAGERAPRPRDQQMTDLQMHATNSASAPGYLGVDYNQYFDNAFTKAFGLNSQSTLEKLAEALKQQTQTYRLLPNPDMDFIKIVEKLRLEAYRDPVGIWTIGYGHTPSYPGQTITKDFAEVLWWWNSTAFALGVAKFVSDVPTTPNQLSAMVSLAYNIGIGAFESSKVLSYHRGEDYANAAESFLLWSKGHVDSELVTIPGLLDRRRAESALYKSP
jgi:lysozyme